MKFMAKHLSPQWISLLLLSLEVIRLVHSDLSSLNIGCGRNDSFVDSDGKSWVGDYVYVHTGTPAKVSNAIPAPHESLSTLRFFPNTTSDDPLSKDCYTIGGVPNGSTITVTSMFFYGNYDGRNQSPHFQIRYNTNPWKNIAAGVNATVTYSLTYTVLFQVISVCFAVPFDDYMNKSFVNSIQFQVWDESQKKARARRLVAAIVVPIIVTFLILVAGVIYWRKKRKQRTT